jgi:tetratricopeptide (TPR) repeat protein
MLSQPDSAQLAKAFQLLQANRADLAMSIAGELAARNPDSADALHMLALCRKAVGDDAGSMAAFVAALERAPGDPNLLGNYANHLARMGRSAEAVELYRRALAIAPGHGDAWMNLCLALLRLGDAGAACEAAERAVAVRPDSAAAWQVPRWPSGAPCRSPPGRARRGPAWAWCAVCWATRPTRWIATWPRAARASADPSSRMPRRARISISAMPRMHWKWLVA